jgi:hypothetical protein
MYARGKDSPSEIWEARWEFPTDRRNPKGSALGARKSSPRTGLLIGRISPGAPGAEKHAEWIEAPVLALVVVA